MRLFPELADQFGIGRSRVDDVAPDRHHLFAAIGDLVAILARRQPVVLIVEDLHWSSTQTLDLLRFLLRSDLLGGVSLLVTLRPREAAASSVAADLLEWLTTEHHPTRIDVTPLEQQEVAALCQAILGLPASATLDALARHLASQTGGNALFCSEMLRSLKGNAMLLSSEPDAIVTLVVVPPTVQELALSRVRKLGADAAEVLADAAVLGESFDLIELQAMSTTDTLRALDVAERAGVVRSDDGGGTKFSFGHALLQQALYDQQTTTGRLRRHRAAADAMAHPAQTKIDVWAFDRLHHLRGSGPLASHHEVAAAATAAAEAATAKLALADAIEFRRLCVDELASAGADHREMATALADLGRAQTANGMQVGRSTMMRAAEAARAASDGDLLADIAISYGGDLKENQAAPDVSEPVTLITGALEHHREPTARRARLLSARAVWQRQHQSFADRLAAVDEALDIARGLDDRRTLAMVVAERHRALHGPNAAAGAIEASFELESLATELGSNTLLFQAMYLRVIAALELGDWRLATTQSERLIVVGASLQNVEGRRVESMWRNLTAQIRGDWDESARQLQDLQRVLSDYPPAEVANFVAAASFIGLWFEHGSGLLHQVAGDSAGRPSTRAWFAAESGAEQAARSSLASAPSVSDLESSLDYMWWHDVVSLTRVSAALGDRALASDLYRILLPYRSSNAMMGFASFMGAAEHHLGTLAATLGLADTAREHFTLAAQRHEAMGAAPFARLTATELAALG